jgi:MoaA/NifB/PqqE/SkfB family radical SAM enzyme
MRYSEGDKRVELLDYLAYIHMLSIIRKRPLDINIETINKCPLKCVFCCNRLYQRDYTVMDNKLFEDIVYQYVKMGGYNRDRFNAI